MYKRRQGLQTKKEFGTVHGERKEWNRTKQVRARDTSIPEGDDRTGNIALNY